MAAPKPLLEHLFNPTTENETLGSKLSPFLPPGSPRRWLQALGAGLKPWSFFLAWDRLGMPSGMGELCLRVGHNLETFGSNYLCVFLGLLLYCLVTSPLLLLALGVLLASCYWIRLRAQQGPLVLLGRELPAPHQYALGAAVSIPVLWLAGAGAAVFWVLGATVVLIGSHAALRQVEPPEAPPPLQMEPV